MGVFDIKPFEPPDGFFEPIGPRDAASGLPQGKRVHRPLSPTHAPEILPPQVRSPPTSGPGPYTVELMGPQPEPRRRPPRPPALPPSDNVVFQYDRRDPWLDPSAIADDDW